MRRSLLVLPLVLVVLPGQGAQNKSADKHHPANAVANLEVHPDLTATLFASEPMITNPTNLDIDHRGRVWICDVKNYRGHLGKRPEGDRILILEDTNHDGRADKTTTFYQGRDVDSAMGICVLGNKVIVSCSPNVLVFTFDPATDKILKKEALFTKTGSAQHDHSAHSFIFGPDGKLYWNFGNTGHAVHDKDGNPIIDLAGNVVSDRGQPYRNGMVFRCDPDGGNFEVLAHNFRNNYEVTVDSFGTIWQSDNDDDGNRGVRINYVMEFGNFGYVDEMTGAGWNSKRTNLETDISPRHWHQNDPGVVPNLLHTGNGSPVGICLYEGTLFPKVFQQQIIHCDAGPSVVRSYPVIPDGAGYKVTQIVNILDGQKKNNWFRPADVCVAPDGSLYVTDWYDPGVGGHAQGDIDRGRIFRVAPPGPPPLPPLGKGGNGGVPAFDFSTLEGNIEGLKNPNLAVRYLAWTNLHQQQAKAEPALRILFQAADPVYRARALWLLGKIDGRGQDYVKAALHDADPNIRILGLRLARQLKHDVIPLVRQLAADSSPAVRRECAIALRHHSSAEAAKLWASLARRHDGKDRWYLEALGIGADKQWDSFLDALLKNGSSASLLSQTYRDILWRSRAACTPDYLAHIILAPTTPAEELPRLFRAFDFQKASPAKEAALLKLALAENGNQARRGLVITEALLRLPSLDLRKLPQLAAAVNRLLDSLRDTSTFVDLVARFNLNDRYTDLLAMAQKRPAEQIGVDAMRVLLDRDQKALVRAGLDNPKIEIGLATVQALAHAGHERSVPLLLNVVKNPNKDLELRRQATRALAKSRPGAMQLLKMARGQKLAKELTQAAGSALTVAKWKEIKQQAVDLFPLPPAKNHTRVPPIFELVEHRGNAARGKEVFAKAGTCANCHVVNGQGKEVGPNLSEIGKKLSREALYESILFPSAGISHNYETYIIETKSGAVVNGILVSQTPNEVTIKDVDALARTFKKADVESFNRSPISLMPADLHKDLTVQDLADVVEYLLTLR